MKQEEEFYDLVGEYLLESDNLVVQEASPFLSGSMDAFRYMMERMGSIHGRRILDYGCGSGWLSVHLAQLGAQVDGFDISGKLIEVASARAGANGISNVCNFRKMTAERLEYPDRYFDLVAGISILHHVELAPAAQQLQRVMKKGAVAIFIEPLGENPVLNWTRDRVFNVHHGLKKDKSTERPLTYNDMHTIGQDFAACNWKEFQLLSMVKRVAGDRLTEAMRIHKLDDWLLSRLPPLRRFCRLIVIEFRNG